MMRARAVRVAIGALLVVITGQALWLSPAAQEALGIARPQLTGEFDICGLHLRIRDAYAGSAWTVLTFSGMPPNVMTGGDLWDQFGFQYPGDRAHNDNAGEIALGFGPANSLTALAGLRFTMTMTACDSNVEQQRSVTVARGSVLFDEGRDLAAPPPGRLAYGNVTFESVRYRSRVVSIAFQARGIDVVGGFPPGEASRPAAPGLDAQLIPVAGGPSQQMWLREKVSGDTTEIRAMATLVDPGAYSLVLSIKGVGSLERSIVVG